MRSLRRWLSAACLLGAGAVLYAQDGGGQDGGKAAATADGRHVAVMAISGAIGPAAADFLNSTHRQAVDEGAAALVLEMDTPGGLDSAMRDMIQTILNSPIPVITWVTPEGARAASAGTYILYASHVAAMAPATNLGSATPVSLGGGSPGGPPGSDPRDRFPGAGKDGEDGGEEGGSGAEGGAPEASGAASEATDDSRQDDAAADPEAQKAPEGASAMEKKVINDAVAYIRGLAEKRGRNADWAERAVREGVSLSSSEALERNVIDVVASSLPELLEAVEGREVAVAGGAVATLALGDAEIRRHEPGWRYQFLSIITNPTIAYVLLMVGIYGLLLEGYNPGAILPGTVGAISLLLALYALQLMPVNYVGLGLIVLGIVLMIAEALAPSFGILGFGGIAGFILGSILLMDSDVPGYGINIGVIIGLATVSALVLGVTLYLLFKSRRTQITTGDEGTVDGRIGEITRFADGEGWLRLAGELWRCRSDAPLQPGERVRVLRHDGFVFEVEPLSQDRNSRSASSSQTQQEA